MKKQRKNRKDNVNILAGKYYLMGEDKLKAGLYEDAIQHLTEAIHLNPNVAESYDLRGRARNELGQHKSAIKDFTTAIDLNPDYAEAYHNRGIAKYALGRYEPAIEDFDVALRLNIVNVVKHYQHRGVAKHALGKYKEAIEDCDKVVQLQPDYAGVYYLRGRSRLGLDQLLEAKQDFQTALKLVKNTDDELKRLIQEMLDDID